MSEGLLDRGAIDPFTLLPNELVVAIASYLHNDAIQKIQATVHNLRKHLFLEPILVLASVSRWLRNAIISEPAFWCYVNITDPNTKLETLSTVLERSGNYPLEIVWIDRLYSRRERNLRLFEVLADHSHRWRALTLLASTITCLSSMVEDISATYTPMLAKFHIANLGQWTVIQGVTEMSFPVLKSFRLANYPLSSMKIGFASLTHMELAPSEGGRLSEKDVRSAATALTSLEYLNLDTAFDVATWEDDATENTDWESLRTLILKDRKFYLWRYLDSMNCPNLRRLVLLDAGWFDFPMEKMQHIMANFPEVEIMDLVQIRLQREDQGSWALSEAFPRLSRLSFSYEPWESEGNKGYDNFFRPSSLVAGGWPNLKILELGSVARESWLKDIVSFVESREDEGHPLTAVGIPENEPGMEAALKDRGQVALFTCSVSTLDQYEITPSRK
ncbi:hypothetical protein BDN72DRAFT_835870 [Pluteus cervinus]|uniref:Uncharacterized protein n=1 Tax=Pluteus cervinus TaxID=181527 RepID=A0ACD3B4M7_9AGAR|nr:hypothetical protein BDN72DRAFT_835870 [Pluteus cervinus]